MIRAHRDKPVTLLGKDKFINNEWQIDRRARIDGHRRERGQAIYSADACQRLSTQPGAVGYCARGV
jgi:hypothetical protein